MAKPGEDRQRRGRAYCARAIGSILLPMSDELYLSYRQIHRTVKSIAQQIETDGFDPDIIVAIGTGGFIPARILKTFIDRPILTVGIRAYDENNRLTERPQKIQWIDEVEKKLTGQKILLVDEVDDTRTTLEYCLNELYSHRPAETAVAVLHRKRKEKRGVIPDFVKRSFVGMEVDDVWIAYPWDALDIDAHCDIADARDKLAREESGGSTTILIRGFFVGMITS